MHLDPALPSIVSTLLTILLVGMGLHRMKLPHVVSYIFTGIILGPHVFGLIIDHPLIERLGAMGVVFLLFCSLFGEFLGFLYRPLFPFAVSVME